LLELVNKRIVFMNSEFLKLILKRFFSSIIVLFLLVTFVFILIRLAPGDPAQKYLSPKLSPELIEKVKSSYKLDMTMSEQYLSYMGNFVKGDLGISYSYRKPVTEVISEFLPLTLILSSSSFLIQIILSFLLTILAIKKVDGFIDKFLSRSVIIVYVIPTFVLGLILIYFFSIKWGVLPSSGIKSFGEGEKSFLLILFDYIKHLILPIATLSIGGVAVFYKYLRDNVTDVYNRTYIQFLRANGLPERKILLHHVIPNAVNPLISVAGVELGLLLSGTLITEIIFSLPGMGRLTMDAILMRDYPLVIGCTLTASVLILLSNFAADLIKAIIDKRFVKGLA
jgi:peptide/nickel transport system permease protein